MGETLVRKQNIDFYAKEETTAGTLITNTATDAIRITDDDLELNLDRNLIAPGYITGSLGATAPQAGMWSDDLGGQVGFFARGGASTPRPDSHVLLKCLFGAEEAQAADLVGTAGTLTTDEFTVDTVANFGAGEMVRVQTDTAVFSVAKILSIASNELTVWPPLLETPADGDAIQAAYSYVLKDSGHPTMSMFAYMEGTKRLAYAGCRPRSLNMTFEVGERIPMIFTFSGLTPYRDYTADPVSSPTYQTTPSPLITLGIAGSFTYAGTAQGVPTTTATIINEPSFEVAIGDYISIDVGAGIWETVLISNVTGTGAGSDLTLTHAAVSVAASADDTVYVKRVAECATIGSSLDLTLEYEWFPINCITATYGKAASTYGNRTITLNKNAYFRSWEEFMKRDNVVGGELMVIAGDTANNIMVLYMPNVINTEPSLAMDNLVMNPTAMQAILGNTTGNTEELTLAYF
jgi:hypothetical protein